MKGMPIPISFMIVVVMTIMLIIFCGAWAVSADKEELNRQSAFVIGGSSPDLGGNPLNSSQTAEELGPGEEESGGSKADAWWGKALIKACPLH